MDEGVAHAHGRLPRSAPPGRPQAEGSTGLWGLVSSIDNAIAGTFDKVADEMKDAAQLIRDQGMARAVKSAVEHSLGGSGRDVVVQVRPPVQPPGFPQQQLEEKLRPAAETPQLEERPGLPGQQPEEKLRPAAETPQLEEKEKLRPAAETPRLGGPEEKLRHDEPRTGSAGLPSRGSELHGSRLCRPCAFAQQGGPSACRNGHECQFCHLCEPGEKKRRRKEWHKNKREEKEGALSLRSVGTAPGKLASMGGDDEDEVLPAPAEQASPSIRRRASFAGGLLDWEEPEVLDWADASGY